MTDNDLELYRMHADDLTRYATVLVGPDDAADVVTDAVLSVFHSAGWRRAEHHRAYLYRAVLNTAKMRHRSNARRRLREERHARRLSPAVAPPPESAIDVHRALQQLSPRQRAVVYLTYWHDLPPADVADMLALSEGSVRKHLARARATLRKVIDDE